MAVQESMTVRERVMRTFRRQPIDRIVWQPRIYYWYYGSRLQNKLPPGYEDRSLLDRLYEAIQAYDGVVPERFKGKTMLEIYDDLDASPRYPQECLGVNLFKQEFDDTIKRTTRLKGEERTTFQETPVGTLREVTRHGYHTEYPIKTPEVMRVMRYILDHSDFRFDADACEAADRGVGDRGPLHCFYPRSPLQRLIISYMGFENTTYALMDHLAETHELLDAIDTWDDRMYAVLLSSPLQILNFGENTDANFDSPRLYQEYLLPYYQKRVAQIHEAGKFCYIHMDGSLKPLLPFISEAGFDAIEAATPLPQGDVTLEEIKEALGDALLIDGIPAILFLPNQPEQVLEEFAIKVLEMFSPNLILGVSDEVPPTADIERVGLVSRIVRDYRPFATMP